MNQVFPVLTPLAIDPAHPFPFIANMGLVIALKLTRDEDGHSMRALIPIPPSVDRFARLPMTEKPGTLRFVLLEDVVDLFMQRLFPGFRVVGFGTFRLIRDTDVEFAEEAEDLVQSYEKALKRRRRGNVIHLSIEQEMPSDLREFVIDAVKVDIGNVHVYDGLQGIADVKQVLFLFFVFLFCLSFLFI